MSVTFSEPLANAIDYPRATIKAQPSLQLKFLAGDGKGVISKKGVSGFSKARYALYHAAQQLKQSEESVVLLPAYHCPALVEPFIAAGYQLRFYPLRADLTVDNDVFQSVMTDDITHIVIVRYFGFSQNTEQLIVKAALTGKVIIEDVAHSLHQFIRRLSQPSPIAACITSLPKTLGTPDGGLLWLADATIYPKQKPALKKEIKSFISHIMPERAPVTGTTSVDNRVNSPKKSSDSFRYFKEQEKDKRCLLISSFGLCQAELDQVRQLRRQHFTFLATSLAYSRLGKPLYSKLHDDDVPYVFPFLLNDLEGFHILRRAGIQVLRWEELVETDCKVSKHYRQYLVQLPLHQQISTEELQKIVQLLV